MADAAVWVNELYERIILDWDSGDVKADQVEFILPS